MSAGTCMHVIIVETKQCGIDWLFQNQPIHRCKMEKITKKKNYNQKIESSILDESFVYSIEFVVDLLFTHFQFTSILKPWNMNDWLSTIHGNALENDYIYHRMLWIGTHKCYWLALLLHFNRFIDIWKVKLPFLLWISFAVLGN